MDDKISQGLGLEQPAEIDLRTLNGKYLVRIIILIVLNTSLFSVVPIDGRTVYDRFILGVQVSFMSIPTLGFIFGLIVATMPFRGLEYNKKYLRSSLLTIYVIHMIFIAMLVTAIVSMLVNGNL